MKKSKPSIPVVKFYGEESGWVTPDLLYYEPLIYRAALHQFSIKPHRHHGLTQLLYLQKGTGVAHLDDEEYKLEPPVVLLLAEMSVHDFELSTDVEGHVLSIASPLKQRLEQLIGIANPILRETALFPVVTNRGYVNGLYSALAQEFPEYAPTRTLMLESLVTLIMVWLSRQSLQVTAPEGVTDRGNQHFIAFTRMIDKCYRKQLPVASYADKLGVTAAHLNAICKKIANTSALQLIHQRLILEAKRLLIYTATSISEISYDLGFSDPAYFTRFFKRLTGESPKPFRQTGMDVPGDSGGTQVRKG